MKILLNQQSVTNVIALMADQIINAWNTFEKLNNKSVDLALVGIRSRGGPLSDRLLLLIEQKTARKVKKGLLDITLYRDDLSRLNGRPIVKATDIAFSIEGTLLFIVDDVLYTGRTIRAALDALFDLGRPEAVKLAVLIDRGGRELPIQGDIVGVHEVVKGNETVHVCLNEIDGKDEVMIESK